MNFCLQVKTADIFAVSVETLDKLSSVTNFELGHGKGGGHGTWCCSVVIFIIEFRKYRVRPNKLCSLQKI